MDFGVIRMKQLKNDKSRDAIGHANELFALSVAGKDLLEAVLNLVNMIKERQEFPTALQMCNISLIHKKDPRKTLKIIGECSGFLYFEVSLINSYT